MKKGKYVGHEFTAKQELAREKWRASQKRRFQILAGLTITDYQRNRATMHKRLDVLLDRIEKQEKQALELFSDVEESFTIAHMTIKV